MLNQIMITIKSVIRTRYQRFYFLKRFFVLLKVAKEENCIFARFFFAAENMHFGDRIVNYFQHFKRKFNKIQTFDDRD